MIKAVLISLLLLAAASRPAKKGAVLHIQPIELALDQFKDIKFTNLNESKALMINVEHAVDKTIFSEFQVTITSQASPDSVCQFHYANNLCVMEHPNKEALVRVKCTSAHCKTSLVFSHRLVVKADDPQSKKKLSVSGQIYRLSKHKFNSILQIYAEREEHKMLASQLTVYCNIHAFPLQQVEQLDTNSAIFGLKPITKESDQYLYIQNKSNRNQKLKAIIKENHGQLRDGITIVDFIENYGKHSHNNYTYMGEIRNNMQVNVRVFSPRDPKDIPFTLIVKGKASEKEELVQIRSLKFQPIDFQGQKFFDFIFAVSKAVHSPFKFIELQLLLGQVQDKSTFFEIGVSDVQAFSVSIFQHIYFASKAKEALHFSVASQVQLQLSDGDKDIQILTNAEQKYFASIQACSLHKGCDIELKTENECSNCSFKFDLRDQDIHNHVIYYDVKNESIEGKVDLQEEIYFKYAMNGKAASQIVVNSINVIIYANFDNYKRCKIPTAACHQYAINQQNPIIVRNPEDQPAELIIGVVGLEKTSFKIRFLNQINGLQVKLGQKFSYLMDDEQKQLQIRYIFTKEDLQRTGEHLHFNLISPLHSMRITVTNEAAKMESVEGYISFDKTSIKGDLFIIKIEKINLYYDQYVHFTLVISTNDVAVRLDSTSTHYERYGIQAVKKFLMEYEPSDSNAINIYTENMQKERGSMVLTIRDSKSSEEDGKASPILTRKLVRDYEFIDLDAELEQLDICDDVNCQLQITIKSEAKVELQQSITLLKQQSVINLDDSIWSVFQINQLSRKNHFYFIPRHQNKSITILFNTDDNHLFVNYMIFNYKNSINPADWPFGHQNTADAGHISSTQEIDIPGNEPELQACWPTCAILINLNQGYQKDENMQLDHSVIKSYKILATNTIFELPEDTKLDFTLRNQEEKVLFILAKNILKYQKLTFFTYYTFGRGRITASLMSNDKEYQINDGNVFLFEELETSLPIYKILSVIDKENLNKETVMVKISILAETTLKMTLEYSSFIRDVYSLRMDELQVCSLRRGEETWYEFIPERDFTLKLYRVKGFPLTMMIKCSEENYIQCLSRDKKYLQLKAKEFQQTQATLKSNLDKEIASNEESNKTELQVFVQKSLQIKGKGCDKCIYVLWVYCYEGDLEMTINLRTRYSEIQLKEMAVFNERLDPGRHNRYLINRLHDKDTTVTIKILEGAARVDIVENSLMLYNETLDSVDNDYKDFTIDADNEEEEQEEEQEEADDSNFGLTRKSNNKHVFSHAHVTVSSLSQKPVEFLISYSVGASGVYLQDGIVVEKEMSAGTVHTLYYRNKNKKERAYLSLSSELLKNDGKDTSNVLSVNFYYYPDAGNRKIKENFQPELPPNRNQNYLGETISHIYELPSKYQLYEIQVQATSNQKMTASINHQQLVYLPLGFEYLIKLHENEKLNLVVDRPDSEYLEVRIKKCDVSSPSLQYTNDARQFKKGIFEAEVDIDNSRFRQYIQTKKSSKTIHFQIIGSTDSESLLTISVQSSSKEQKFNTMNFKPGNKGAISYKMVETDLVEVSFKPVTCDGKECQVPFNYFLVIASSIDQIYGELNCANTFFIPMAKKLLESSKAKTEVIQLNNKHFDKKLGEYTYRVKLQEKQEFLGVKGVMEGSKEEVQYLPVEIRNIWGQLSRVSFGIVFMVSLALALLFTLVIVVSTKLARRGYKPIASSE